MDNTFEWTEQTPLSPNNLNEMQNIINDNIEEKAQEIKSELQFKAGTTIKTVGSGNDAVQLFTLAELRTQFNAPSATATQFYAIANNGDGLSNGKHFESCTWVNNVLYVVWNGTLSASASTRINYLIFYVP